MKTISVSDELYTLLESAAARANKPDIESFLIEMKEVQDEKGRAKAEQRITAEREQIEMLKQRSIGDRPLWKKFMRAMDAMYRVDPDRFSNLEGLTKENGDTIYVSSDEIRIRNSATETKPVRIAGSIWFINANVGKEDAPLVIDKARSLLGLSAGFGEELKKNTLLAEGIVLTGL